jgi:putative membrane protein
LFLEILLFTFIGILGGIIAGLTPGIHTNTLILIVLGLLPLLAGFPIQAVVALIVSMAITSTLVDFIPSIFLNAPSEDTALSILPGHRLLLEGKGLEAIFLSVIGGIGVIILFILLSPLMLKFLPVIYSFAKSRMALLLLIVAGVMVLTEKGKKKLWALSVFLLAGILGLVTLNSTLIQPDFVFFPLFTGMFGISAILLSLKDKTNLPKQLSDFGVVKKSLAVIGSIKGFFAGLLVGILPGLGSAQAGTLVQTITRKDDNKEFLVSLGGINTANALFAITALYTISRPRSGAAVAIEKILENFGFNDFLMVIAVSLVTIGIGAIATLFLSKRFLTLVQKFSYKKISLSILGLLLILTIIFTGPIGLLVLVISTAIGLIAPLTGVKRSLGMSVIIMPVILFYLGIIL